MRFYYRRAMRYSISALGERFQKKFPCGRKLVILRVLKALSKLVVSPGLFLKKSRNAKKNIEHACETDAQAGAAYKNDPGRRRQFGS